MMKIIMIIMIKVMTALKALLSHFFFNF